MNKYKNGYVWDDKDTKSKERKLSGAENQIAKQKEANLKRVCLHDLM